MPKREIKEQLKRYKLIQYISNAMNSSKAPVDLLETMLDECISLTGAGTGSIMMQDENPDYLKMVVYRGFDDSSVATMRVKSGEGVTGVVFRDGIPKLVNNVTLEPIYISLRKDIRSELAVPLTVNGKVMGVISVDATKEDAFHELDLELLQTVANQAAQILHRTTLNLALERKIKLKDVLFELANSLENIFELKDVFELVMKELSHHFSILRGMLVLFNPASQDELSIFAAYQLTEEEMSRGIYKVGEGIIGKAVETGEPAYAIDINKDKSFLNRMQVPRPKNKAISFLAVPFTIEGKVAGVIAVEKLYESIAILRDDKDIIFLIGNMIANKVKAYQRNNEEKRHLLEENRQLKKELFKTYGINNIIGRNPKMLELFDLIGMVADSNTSVLINGESGTGKELVAKALHFNSSRRDKPFVSINCAAIPESLLESELFGYKKGAFTGATVDRKGKFQQADGGTLFLDEIGDMPIYLQAKLLRVIQEKEVEPVGSDHKVKVDIRILSATHRNLTEFIKKGEFREDLYYRLNVIQLDIPPLRERKDDIPLLVDYFIQKYGKENNRQVEGIAPESLRLLQSYSWPGNIRELENMIERAVLLCRGKLIDTPNFPSHVVQTEEEIVDDVQMVRWIEHFLKYRAVHGKVHEVIVGYIEKELITKSLLLNGRNKVRTAAFLGINRNTLRFKMHEYQIDM